MLFFFFFGRTCPGSVASTLDTNKYKFLMKIAIDDLEIVKGIYINSYFILGLNSKKNIDQMEPN